MTTPLDAAYLHRWLDGADKDPAKHFQVEAVQHGLDHLTTLAEMRGSDTAVARRALGV